MGSARLWSPPETPFLPPLAHHPTPRVAPREPVDSGHVALVARHCVRPCPRQRPQPCHPSSGPFVHIELHLFVREYQGPLYAEPTRAARESPARPLHHATPRHTPHHHTMPLPHAIAPRTAAPPPTRALPPPTRAFPFRIRRPGLRTPSPPPLTPHPHPGRCASSSSLSFVIRSSTCRISSSKCRLSASSFLTSGRLPGSSACSKLWSRRHDTVTACETECVSCSLRHGKREATPSGVARARRLVVEAPDGWVGGRLGLGG